MMSLQDDKVCGCFSVLILYDLEPQLVNIINHTISQKPCYSLCAYINYLVYTITYPQT